SRSTLSLHDALPISPLRQPRHAYLADRVEIQVLRVVHGGQDLPALPAGIVEFAVQDRLLRGLVFRNGRPWRAEDEDEHGAITAQRETPYLPPGHVVGHVDQLVARPVAFHHAGRDPAAEVMLVVALGPEREAAHVRVQAVRADHQVEVALVAAFEAHAHAGVVRLQRCDAVAEARLHPVADRVVHDRGKVAARQAGEGAAREFVEAFGADFGLYLPVTPDCAQGVHLVPRLLHRALDAHAPRDAIAGTPEVDHVAAGAEGRRALDQ